MAAFVMQVLGCQVAALNTVQYSRLSSHFWVAFLQTRIACSQSQIEPVFCPSCRVHKETFFTHPQDFLYPLLIDSDSLEGNHAGYRQFRGTRTSPEEIADLYAGLVQSNLVDFDMLLTGYAPGAEAVEAIGAIARDLKGRATGRPGSFFWGEWFQELLIA